VPCSIPRNSSSFTPASRPTAEFRRESDRAISALSSHFIDADCRPIPVIAFNCPHRRFRLTVLAAHRAGLLVACFRYCGWQAY